MIDSSIPPEGDQTARDDNASWKRRVLLDVSLFTDYYLDEDALREHASEVVLEIPAALMTMIRFAQADVERSLLVELLYGYLQARLPAKEEREAGKGRSKEEIESESSQTLARLRKRALELAKMVVRTYAPLIQGLEEAPTVMPSEDQPADLAQRTGAAARPIRPYVAFNPVTDQVREGLRQVYGDKLELRPDPLFDLYFLQLYHSERFGIAASPAMPRWVVSVGTSTFEIIRDAFGYSRTHLRRQAIQLTNDLEPVTRPAVEFLNWFTNTYLRREWKEAALTGALELAVGLVPVSVPPAVPILVTMAGGLLIGAVLQADMIPPWAKPWLIGGIIVVSVLFIFLLSVLMGRLGDDVPLVRSLIIKYEFVRGPAPTPANALGLVSKPSTQTPGGGAASGTSTPTPEPTLSPAAPIPPGSERLPSGPLVVEDVTPIEMASVVPIPVVVQPVSLSPDVPPTTLGADLWATGSSRSSLYVGNDSYGGICYYVTQPGDTVQGIAARFGVPAESIRGTQGQTVYDLRLH